MSAAAISAPPIPRRTVSSVFANLEYLLELEHPRWCQAPLGASWGFTRLDDLTEYTLPCGYVDALHTRTGVTIALHTGADDLDAHLAAGGRAIVAVDSFHLPYRPAYGRVHSGRTIVAGPAVDDALVEVVDRWAPAYTGPLSRETLWRARWSRLPFDRRLEPLLSGWTIRGEWLSVKACPQRATPGWAGARLADVLSDWHDTGEAEQLARLRASLRGPLAAAAGDDAQARVRRSASLTLRAELSARVYLCALLRTAARELQDDIVASEVDRFLERLRHLEAARDVLCKSVAMPRPEYAACVLDDLAAALDAERRLAEALAWAVSR